MKNWSLHIHNDINCEDESFLENDGGFNQTEPFPFIPENKLRTENSMNFSYCTNDLVEHYL